MLHSPLGTLAFCISKGLPPAILQPASHLQLPTLSHKLPGQHTPEHLWQYSSRDTLVCYPSPGLTLANPDTCEPCCYGRFPRKAIATDVKITPSFSPFLISTFGCSFWFTLQDSSMHLQKGEQWTSHVAPSQSTHALSNVKSIISRNNTGGVWVCLDIKYRVIVRKSGEGAEGWTLTFLSGWPLRRVFPFSFSHHLSLLLLFFFSFHSPPLPNYPPLESMNAIKYKPASKSSRNTQWTVTTLSITFLIIW